MWWTIK